MGEAYRVVQFGCGPMGCRMVQSAIERPSLQLVGAVDIDTGKIGRDLGEVAEIGRQLGVVVAGSIEQAIAAVGSGKVDVALHTTGSKLPQVAPQITDLLRRGMNVVSTCEELSFPYRDQSEIAAKIDAEARRCGTSVLGTGINPGFLMDT